MFFSANNDLLIEVLDVQQLLIYTNQGIKNDQEKSIECSIGVGCRFNIFVSLGSMWRLSLWKCGR